MSMLLKEIKPLTLASLSPRRLTLLQSLGLNPQVISRSYVEEDNRGNNLAEIAVKNAQLKFTAASAHLSGWILAADTLVGLDSHMLGKPGDASEAKAMLQLLSGKTHQVITAYSLGLGGELQAKLTRAVLSAVTFKTVSAAWIDSYVATGEPLDKAGAYGIQGMGVHLIERLHGSPSNVMGLPLIETMMDLVRLQIACFACPN